MKKKLKIKCIDLFCGVGGLTHGLQRAGVNVVAGIDADQSCEYAYTTNNKAKFIHSDVEKLTSTQLKGLLKRADFTMIAGCAPCQPFSTYTRGGERQKRDWKLLYSFLNHISEIKPDFVTMENVPGISKHKVYLDFVMNLEDLGYFVTGIEAAYCPSFGIPQRRKRLLLFASLHGSVSPPSPTHNSGEYLTVRKTIAHLPPIIAGGTTADDRLHTSAGLTEINLRRIQASKPGGTWRDWPEELVAACHKKKTGATYPSVYGRMKWDFPAPTITTQFHGFGNGRFGHPEQDRAISLREAAMLQTFPENYKFIPDSETVRFDHIGRQIGNAVPVRLGEVIGNAFVTHVQHIKQQKNSLTVL